MDKFIHHIDNSLGIIVNAYRLPVVVIGPERMVGHFASLTKYQRFIFQYIHYNTSRLSDNELLFQLTTSLKDSEALVNFNLFSQLDEAKDKFDALSSGHKIVLLSMTRLIQVVEEKTLVLLDEPEAHLHPPLLSTFVRALSDLLSYRNAIAIISTHSPVVLQEVPLNCVWKLRRNGSIITPERPKMETFGENVGTLTHEVFGLEVTDSGFHRMLIEAVEENPNFEAVLEKFDNQIGAEGQSIIRSLIANKRRRIVE